METKSGGLPKSDMGPTLEYRKARNVSSWMVDLGRLEKLEGRTGKGVSMEGQTRGDLRNFNKDGIRGTGSLRKMYHIRKGL